MDVRRAPAYSTADAKTQIAIERLRYRLSRLHTSPQLAAVLDCLFDLYPERTNPIFEELVVVDDRLIFARIMGEKTFRHFVGRREQLVLNLLGFVQHLHMGNLEREYVLSRVASIPRRQSRR